MGSGALLAPPLHPLFSLRRPVFHPVAEVSHEVFKGVLILQVTLLHFCHIFQLNPLREILLWRPLSRWGGGVPFEAFTARKLFIIFVAKNPEKIMADVIAASSLDFFLVGVSHLRWGVIPQQQLFSFLVGGWGILGRFAVASILVDVADPHGAPILGSNHPHITSTLRSHKAVGEVTWIYWLKPATSVVLYIANIYNHLTVNARFCR